VAYGKIKWRDVVMQFSGVLGRGCRSGWEEMGEVFMIFKNGAGACTQNIPGL